MSNEEEEQQLLIEHYSTQIMLKNNVVIKGLPKHIEKAVLNEFTERPIIKNIGAIPFPEEKL